MQSAQVSMKHQVSNMFQLGIIRSARTADHRAHLAQFTGGKQEQNCCLKTLAADQ